MKHLIRSIIIILGICTLSASAVAIGFDQRGAQEAAGSNREFDDATRLRQMQEAPQLPPVPVVEVPKPTPPPTDQTAGANSNGAPLLRVEQQMSTEQAKKVLQQADKQIRQERRGGLWHTAWRLVLWTSLGALLAWGVWTWMVRRASESLRM